MSKSSDIFALAEEVPEDQTMRFVCPVCEGGSDHEKSLAITRFDNITVKWFCHRASCGARGESYSPGLPSRQRARPKPEVDIFYECQPVHRETVLPYLATYFERRLGEDYAKILSTYEVSTLIDDPNLIQYKLRDYNGEQLGFLHQRHHPSYKKTSRIYKTAYPNRPIYGCYGFLTSFPRSSQVWLVEDCLSAIKLAKAGARAIALLGTHTPEQLIARLHNAYDKDIDFLLCLDWDAAGQAVRDGQRVRQNLGVEITPVFLRKDLKDSPDSYIFDLLENFSARRRKWDIE